MSAAKDESNSAQIVELLTPVAVDNTYSYLAPPGLALRPGDSVKAPLGTREAYGVVWSVDPATPGRGANLKTVTSRLDRPPLSQRLRDFLDWLARYTLTPRGMALRLATRAAEEAEEDKPRTLYRLTCSPPPCGEGLGEGVARSNRDCATPLPNPPPQGGRESDSECWPGIRMTPTRARVLTAAEGGMAFSKKALAEAAGCSAGVIDALVDEGALEAIAGAPEPVARRLHPDFAAPVLEEAQGVAARALTDALAEKKFRPFLLEGVTGSGKTEVYFEAIAAALREGGQALVMMPEIALTTQFLERFAARFGEKPAEWHSGVSPRKRARIWRGAATGEVSVVAGARSALFLPFRDLRVIVVDEEHEGAYKQEDGASYHARDMAVVRARFEDATIVLASATPSIETRVNATRGRYGWLRLSARAGARPMPALEAIDLRHESPPRGRWIAPRLALAMGETIARGEQALLFLNRRGYAPLTVCRTCGHRFRCENCDAWLVEHRFRRALMCHHCGHVERRPDVCPECQTEDSLAACGPGVERLAEEVATLFPDARTLVLSSDFPGGAERLRRELDEIAKGAFDIVIGTQLVAKGHNFPHLTLVGVVDADLGLGSGDPRAAERTFQLLNQVTGRAGRGDRPGRGLVQTFQPDHPVIKALLSGDAEKFYAQEIALRARARLPPFGRLAALIVSGKDAMETEAYARALARAAYELPASSRYRLAQLGALPEEGDMLLLGPAEAPIALVRGRYRYRLLAKAPKSADVQGFLHDLLGAAPKPRGSLRVQIDIDPQSFL